MNDQITFILKELTRVMSAIDHSASEVLIQTILDSNIVVTCGAGRMGFAAKAFSMRLGHLGKASYTIGDSAVPHIGKGDLLIVASGSGETPSILTLVETAKKHKATITLITTRASSSMSRFADITVMIPAYNKLSDKQKNSKQPMTTLMEQCTGLYFDALVLELMKRMNVTDSDMWKRHSKLE